jgi:signal transduction histidine kinase
MPVETGEILHVLAHELRTPVGIAHGYVRLLLEGRLSEEAERRRALEQIQKALTRLTELSHESSALAAWYDQNHEASVTVGVRTIVERVAAADFESPVTVDFRQIPEDAILETPDPAALVAAIVSLVRATARESRGAPCAVAGRVDQHHLELLIGPQVEIDTLGDGPAAPDAGPMVLERGGLGLALVHAAVVLHAQGAECWTMKRSRHTAGIRLPLAAAGSRSRGKAHQ